MLLGGGDAEYVDDHDDSYYGHVGDGGRRIATTVECNVRVSQSVSQSVSQPATQSIYR